MRDVAGKVAVITGGVTGIGLGIAKAFLGAGMRVAITHRTEQHLHGALSELASFPEGSVHAVRLDVTDRAAVARAADEIERRFGKIHVLCNNAGVSVLGATDVATYEDWDWILGVNLGGVINSLVTFLPRIKAHGDGGHIINVSSMSAFIVGPLSALYAASKFAVRGLSEGLRFNLAPHNIGVSLVCPGLVRTDIYRSSLGRPAGTATAFSLDEEALNRLAGVHAVGMDPDEVGIKTLHGMLKREFYIFSHSEFRDEVRELCDEIIEAMPDERADPARAAVEEMRRRAKAHARAIVDRFNELSVT